jgi:topoisomerase-4 subunit B
MYRSGDIFVCIFMRFSEGLKKTELEVIGTVGKRNTGTKVKFMPDGKFFDFDTFSISKLRHNLIRLLSVSYA